MLVKPPHLGKQRCHRVERHQRLVVEADDAHVMQSIMSLLLERRRRIRERRRQQQSTTAKNMPNIIATGPGAVWKRSSQSNHHGHAVYQHVKSPDCLLHVIPDDDDHLSTAQPKPLPQTHHNDNQTYRGSALRCPAPLVVGYVGAGVTVPLRMAPSFPLVPEAEKVNKPRYLVRPRFPKVQ